MEQTKIALKVERTYRIGDNTDEGCAATIGEIAHCEICNREIVNVTILTNGARVGSECRDYLTRHDLRQTDAQIAFYFGRRNKKADAYLTAGNYR